MIDLTQHPYDEAAREEWARQRVVAAGEDWSTHTAKFSGAVIPREVSLEPSLAATVNRLDAEEVEPTDWTAYRACSTVCRAPIGKPCFSLSGTVAGGRPDGVRTELTHPHAARRRRTKR